MREEPESAGEPVHVSRRLTFKIAIPAIGFLPAMFLPLLILFSSSCMNDPVFTGTQKDNLPPVVKLTSSPVDGDSVQYNVHFYWIGDDPDGEISRYEIALVDGDPIGFDPSDTTGTERWISTVATDTLLKTSADTYDARTKIDGRPYTLFDRVHTFFIRAIDDRGAVSNVDWCSFNSWTIAPKAIITRPRIINPNNLMSFCPRVKFEWYGIDPIDSPWNYQDVKSFRYMHCLWKIDIIDRLNSHPEDFEGFWSRWIALDAPGDSGRSTILGDDEILVPGNSYTFAVQAKDDAGAVTSIFSKSANTYSFRVVSPTGPILTVSEVFLGSFSFLGYDLDPHQADIPPGFEMNFEWTASAAHYGASVSTYRYGWDIQDLSDPNSWETIPLPTLHSAEPKRLYSGVHTLYVEATDDLGISTVGVIEVCVIPIAMERDLLWIDDFPSSNFFQELYAFPTEAEHDQFWNDICLQAPRFVPDRDTYDIADNAFRPPSMRLVFEYKNLIWTYSSAADPDQGTIWSRMIRYGDTEIINFLPFYMMYGGHVWSCGTSNRMGGLGATLSENSRQYPCDLECDLFDPSPGCKDQSGKNSMAYKDYCVTVIDKVDGIIKIWLPFMRKREYDEMSYAFMDTLDPVTLAAEGLPEKLDLWDMVTSPGMFFDPEVRGLHYVEVYDPDYWMDYKGKAQRNCIHPIYRMRTRSDRSVLDGQTVAFWITKYADAETPGGSNCAAPSVHFGFPLWFFDRAQADSISHVIFSRWEILDP